MNIVPITIENHDIDSIYIDATGIDSGRNEVIENIKKCIEDLKLIRDSYSVIKNDDKTKGVWRTHITECIRKCNLFIDNLQTIQRNLNSTINKTVLEYVQTQIKELQKVQNIAENINVDAGNVKY